MPGVDGLLPSAMIREARRRAGLTQRELARRASTSQSAIARYEQGKAIPSFPALARIVRASGFELRLALAPRSGIDDSLIDLMLDMTVEDRLRTAGRYAGLASQLRNG